MTGTAVRTVVVVRHAKSGHPPGVADFDRPLSDRGMADARAAGTQLRAAIGRPTMVICSPARRAVQTADGILAAYPDDPPPVRYEQRLYEATPAGLLAALAADAGAGPVVLVGHNPSVSAVVGVLTGERVPLRTCGIAVIRLGSTT